MRRFRFALLFVTCILLLRAVPPLDAQAVKKPVKNVIPTITAESYRAKLKRAENALAKMKNGAPHTGASGILHGLLAPDEFKLRRRDGETISANNYEWLRRYDNVKHKTILRMATVREVHTAISQRRRALEEWMNGRNGQLYQPAEAQEVMRQLEGTNQIRTGPTATGKWLSDLWTNARKTFMKVVEAIIGWLNGAAPKAPATPPKIDERWITFFFYSTVLSLLAVLGYLLWRTLGGRWGREGARRDARYLNGEDAELLLLPPGELQARAERFAGEGDYRQALRHLYIALLLHLDARNVWRYDTRRTNWEHIRILRRSPQHQALTEPLSDLTRRFDRVRYGDAACSLEDWTQFARDVESVQTASQSAPTPNNTPQEKELATNSQGGAAS